MNDNDFFAALSDDARPMKKEAQAYFTKRAGSEQAVAEFVRQHATEIGSALAGGSLAALAHYGASRSKRGGESIYQSTQQAMLDAAERSAAKSRERGEATDFKQDMALATAKTGREFADVYTRHPGKSALTMAVPLGLAGGWRVAKMLS